LLQTFQFPFLSLSLSLPFFLETEAAMNLFINSNAQELLKEMKPALKAKLTVLLRNFMENLFSRVPFDEWVE